MISRYARKFAIKTSVENDFGTADEGEETSGPGNFAFGILEANL